MRETRFTRFMVFALSMLDCTCATVGSRLQAHHRHVPHLGRVGARAVDSAQVLLAVVRERGHVLAQLPPQPADEHARRAPVIHLGLGDDGNGRCEVKAAQQAAAEEVVVGWQRAKYLAQARARRGQAGGPIGATRAMSTRASEHLARAF